MSYWYLHCEDAFMKKWSSFKKLTKISIVLTLALSISGVTWLSLNYNCIIERRTEYQPPSQKILSLLGDIKSATNFRYQSADINGTSLDCLNIIEPNIGEYYGVHHTWNGTSFNANLVYSADLLNWTFVVCLARKASMPILYYIEETKSFVLLHEQWIVNEGSETCFIRAAYFPNISSLKAGTPQRVFQTYKTQSDLEGTPNIYNIKENGNIIDVGFHYNSKSGFDLVANGTLRNLVNGTTTWETTVWKDYNRKLQCRGVEGHIGGRKYFQYEGSNIIIQETMLKGDDWGTWCSWYYNCADGGFVSLPVKTHGGSKSITNPHYQFVSNPNNHSEQVLFGSYFVQGKDHAAGEAGELIFFKSLK
jgi:hypothetical protein